MLEWDGNLASYASQPHGAFSGLEKCGWRRWIGLTASYEKRRVPGHRRIHRVSRGGEFKLNLNNQGRRITVRTERHMERVAG